MYKCDWIQQTNERNVLKGNVEFNQMLFWWHDVFGDSFYSKTTVDIFLSSVMILVPVAEWNGKLVFSLNYFFLL